MHRLNLFVQFSLLLLCVRHVSAEQSAGDSGIRWLDDRQLLTMEISDLMDFQSSLQKTDLLLSKHWDDFWTIVSQEEHGLIQEDELIEWRKLWDDFCFDIEPGNVLVSVPSSGVADWQMIIHAQSPELSKKVESLCDRWLQLRNRTEKSNNVENSDDAKTAVHSLEVSKTVGNVKIWDLSICFVCVVDQWVVISGRESVAEVLCKRIQGEGGEYRALGKSRKYHRVKSVINEVGIDNAQLELHFDPKLVWLLSGWFDEKEQRAWGLNEILAAGLAVNIVKSKSRKDRNEVVLNGFVLPSIPRHGISAAVRLEGTPPVLPPLPDDLVGFYYLNMDFEHFGLEKRRLFDFANGEGSYENHLDEANSLSRVMPDEIRQQNLKIAGTVQGNCWFVDSNGKIRSLMFRTVEDADQQIELLKTMTENGSKVMPNYGFNESEIGGFKAMLSKFDVRGSRFGMVFIDNWVLHADEPTLQKQIGMPTTSAFPDRIEEMISELLKHSTIENDRSIVYAIFPRGWEMLSNTYLSQKYGHQLYQQVQKEVGSDFDEIMKRLKSIKSNWDINALSEPKSKAENRRLAEITLSKIAADAFGQFILVGNDNEHGFRLSAMLLPSDKELSEEKLSDEKLKE